MKWKVAIDGSKNERIMVEFDPLVQKIHFIGQFKPHNKEWEVFSKVSTPMKDISLEVIQEKLVETYKIFKLRRDVYIDLVNSFNIIKVVEFKSDDDYDDGIE